MSYSQVPPGTPNGPHYFNGPAQPKKSRKRVWIIGGVLSVLMLSCFGGCTAMVSAAADESGKSSSSGPASVSDTADAASQTAAPTDDETSDDQAPEGPVVAEAGQVITVRPWRIGEDDEVRYTLSDVKKARSQDDWSEPENGTFVTAELEVKVVKGSKFASSGDLSFVTADGTVYEPTWLGGFDGTFDAVELKTGQRKSGLVVFDVPADALDGGQIHVSSFWDDTSYGYWKL